MAYGFVRASSQYLSAPCGNINFTPLTMACWFRATQDTANHVFLSICDGRAGTTQRTQATVRGSVAGDPIGVQSVGTTTSGVAATTSGFTINTWAHGCAVMSGAASRSIYINGGSVGTNTDNVTQATPQVFVMAAQKSNNAFADFLDGDLAEVAFWDVALSVAEIESLAKGFSCRRIRPQSLLFCAPIVRDLQDLRLNATITNGNAATVAVHPRVY